MYQQHVEASLAKVKAIFEEAASIIEALQPGERVVATALADTIARKYGMTGQALYPVMKALLFEGYPGIEARRGAHGGLVKLPINNQAGE
jgi:hypothetical protein